MQVAMMEMETAVGMMILLVAQDLADQSLSLEMKAKTRRTSKRQKLQSPEFMVRMKRQSDWLTQGGKRNWAQAGKSSAWQPQKLRRSKGHTVLWWPQRRGKGTRQEGAGSTVQHSVRSPDMGWQRVCGKGKQPRVLRITNQRKSSGGKAVLLGRGGGQSQAAEIQPAQAVRRAASAVRMAEQAVHDHGNNSAPTMRRKQRWSP
jgi:hypothetical protein